MYYESDFIMGNNLLLKPIYGNGPNHYENVAADIAAAKNSEYLGFALDLNPLQDYIANISAVNDQYTPDLYTGNYTPEKFASYKAALETGGVHDYLDAVQKQLDAWLASR